MNKHLFLLGFVIALLITIADWAVIYGIRNNELSYLNAGFFGSLLFPFLIASYWALYRMVSKDAPKMGMALFLIASYLVAISTLIQGSTSFLEYMKMHAVQLDLVAAPPVFEQGFQMFKLPLYLVGLVLTVAESVLFIAVVIKNNTAYPRWFWLFNRVFLIAYCLGLAFLFPAIKQYIQLLSANLSHVFFFLLLWLYEKNSVKKAI